MRSAVLLIFGGLTLSAPSVQLADIVVEEKLYECFEQHELQRLLSLVRSTAILNLKTSAARDPIGMR